MEKPRNPRETMSRDTTSDVHGVPGSRENHPVEITDTERLSWVLFNCNVTNYSSGLSSDLLPCNIYTREDIDQWIRFKQGRGWAPGISRVGRPPGSRGNGR